MGNFNWALVIVASLVSVGVFLVSVYLLVNYQHRDDVNQAYFPNQESPRVEEKTIPGGFGKQRRYRGESRNCVATAFLCSPLLAAVARRREETERKGKEIGRGRRSVGEEDNTRNQESHATAKEEKTNLLIRVRVCPFSSIITLML